MSQQMYFAQQSLGGSNSSWISATLLACLFLVLILRPERIHNLGRFKGACSLLAMAIIMPPALGGLLLLTAATAILAASGGSMGAWWLQAQAFISTLGPILLGVGAILGLTSLMPLPRQEPDSQPPRHPLE